MQALYDLCWRQRRAIYLYYYLTEGYDQNLAPSPIARTLSATFAAGVRARLMTECGVNIMEPRFALIRDYACGLTIDQLKAEIERCNPQASDGEG